MEGCIRWQYNAFQIDLVGKNCQEQRPKKVVLLADRSVKGGRGSTLTFWLTFTQKVPLVAQMRSSISVLDVIPLFILIQSILNRINLIKRGEGVWPLAEFLCMNSSYVWNLPGGGGLKEYYYILYSPSLLQHTYLYFQCMKLTNNESLLKLYYLIWIFRGKCNLIKVPSLKYLFIK